TSCARARRRAPETEWRTAQSAAADSRRASPRRRGSSRGSGEEGVGSRVRRQRSADQRSYVIGRRAVLLPTPYSQLPAVLSPHPNRLHMTRVRTSLVFAGAALMVAACQASAQQLDSATVAGFRWRTVGPANFMGRTSDVVGIP